MGIIGNQFDGNEVCGAVLSLRFQEDTISVWNRNATNTEAIERIRCTRPAPNERLIFCFLPAPWAIMWSVGVVRCAVCRTCHSKLQQLTIFALCGCAAQGNTAQSFECISSSDDRLQASRGGVAAVTFVRARHRARECSACWFRFF